MSRSARAMRVAKPRRATRDRAQAPQTLSPAGGTPASQSSLLASLARYRQDLGALADFEVASPSSALPLDGAPRSEERTCLVRRSNGARPAGLTLELALGGPIAAFSGLPLSRSCSTRCLLRRVKRARRNRSASRAQPDSTLPAARARPVNSSRPHNRHQHEVSSSFASFLLPSFR